MSKTYASIVCLLISLAVLSPMRRHWNPAIPDSFPLSWYPMFSGARPDIEQMAYVVGRSQGGETRVLPYTYWASGGFNQGRTQLNRIISQGRARVERLCVQIAQRVADRERDDDLVEIAILMGEFDRDRYFGEGIHHPEQVRAFDTCPVLR